MRNLFREPCVPRHHGNPKNFRLRRLDQQQDRLLVRAGGSGRILIDDDLAPVLALGGETYRQYYSYCRNKNP